MTRQLMSVLPPKAGIQNYGKPGFRPRFRGGKHAPAEAGVRNDKPSNDMSWNSSSTITYYHTELPEVGWEFGI